MNVDRKEGREKEGLSKLDFVRPDERVNIFRLEKPPTTQSSTYMPLRVLVL